MVKFTLLTEEQVHNEKKKLDIFKEIGAKAAITDFAILLDGYLFENEYVDYDKSLKGRIGWWRTTSPEKGDVVLHQPILPFKLLS